MLARGGKDASVPWQNPQTGAGGNITPLATSYSEGGLPCRDFLASYVHGAIAGLAAGRGLPHRERHLGSEAAKAPQAELKPAIIAVASFDADSLLFALRDGRFIPTL